MMNAAFSYLLMDSDYIAISIEEEKLELKVEELKNRDVKGMSVTMPFKSTIIPLLDELDAVSSRIGAVNTIKRIDARYVGFNTDVDGIVQPLKSKRARIEHAAVIGAGGATRAFVEAMSRSECEKVSILVREKSKAGRFVSDMIRSFPKMKFELYSIEEGSEGHEDLDLIFNASPIGTLGVHLPDQISRLFRSSMIVFDAVYRPVETELIQRAKEAGSRVIYGHEMLLHQGTAAFELWTGAKAPYEIMKNALLESLREDRKK
jgi:shikimate dehydrogenase